MGSDPFDKQQVLEVRKITSVLYMTSSGGAVFNLPSYLYVLMVANCRGYGMHLSS